MIKKIIFYALIMFSFNLNALEKSILSEIKDNGELRVCTTAGYAPFEVKTSKGKWVGFDIKMFEEFSKKLGVKLSLIDIRWEGVFPALLSKKCEFITGGMSITEERKKVIHFSDIIYKSGNSIVISSKEEKKYKNIKDLDQKNVKIAVKTGNTSDFVLQKTLKNAKILRFDTNADMLTAVLKGRADAFVQDSIYAFMASNENKGKLYIIPEKLNYEDLAVGIRKQDEDLLKEFNSFFADWKKSGGYAEAVQYYIESDKWMEELKR